MNIYLVVEGMVTEPLVYRKWIKYINPKYRFVQDIDEVVKNNIYLISGGGYPGYFDIIEAGANDVKNNKQFDRLVIAIDSEDMSYNQKLAEVTDFVNSLGLSINFSIVVQHFCIET